MGRVWDGPPIIDRYVIERWPTPPGVRSIEWSNWSVDDRGGWLLEHAFVQQDGRWVPRPDLDETGQRVVEAAGLVEDTVQFVTDHFEGVGEQPAASVSGSGGAILGANAVRILAGLILLVLVSAAFLLDAFGGDDPAPTTAELGPGTSTAAEPTPTPTPTPVRPDPADAAVPDPADAGAPAAPADTTDDLVAQAAGTYGIDEGSARTALERTVERFDSARGSIVVAGDGTVTGDFRYAYRDPYADEGLARVTADGRLLAEETGRLVATDAGLVFTGVVTQTIVVTPPESPAYSRDVTWDVTGTVDLSTGRMTLAQTDDDAGLEFQRE